MSNALLRRNSSKQGLQNLMRLTAQRSIEDAEEVEREQRRKAREALCQTNSVSAPEESSPELEISTEKNISPSLEEDEGFSDWNQLRERRRKQRLQELSQGGEEDEEEQEALINKVAPVKPTQASVMSSSRLQQSPETEVEKRKGVKVSYTSKFFLNQEAKHSNSKGNAANKEEASPINKTKRPASVSSRATEPEESEAILETEQRLEKIRHNLQVKESQELEQLRHRQAEAEQELEELKRRREERRRVREEEERQRKEEEKQRLAKEEDEKRQMKENIEKRRVEAAERMKSFSTSSVEGDEMFSPFSPKASTHKITERTESLNRSLKKSNSFKKTQPLILLPKIDDKLEQYAHAVENSQEARAVKASLTDLPSSPEVVASKKNLFEAGEAWGQSPTKGIPCKDTNVLKVGVASRVTQWVKGPCDGSRQAASRQTDVRLGDVMQKKNMWEIIGDSSEMPSQRANNGSAVGKKYKFVFTGHGKYEKIPVDDGDKMEGGFSHGKSDLCDGDY